MRWFASRLFTFKTSVEFIKKARTQEFGPTLLKGQPRPPLRLAFSVERGGSPFPAMLAGCCGSFQRVETHIHSPAGDCEAINERGARLTELELIDRERRMVERRIKSAKFPAVKSLDSFDFNAIPALNKMMVLELARCEWIERQENVIALGPSDPAS